MLNIDPAIVISSGGNNGALTLLSLMFTALITLTNDLVLVNHGLTDSNVLFDVISIVDIASSIITSILLMLYLK